MVQFYSSYFASALSAFFGSFSVNNHFTECESSSSQSAYKESLCSLQTLITLVIKLHMITVWCGGMATTGQAETEREEEEREGAGEQIRVGAGRQGKEKHIILLCTVRRLNLRNSDTRQHKKGQKNLKYVQKKTNKRSFFGEKHTALVAVLEIAQWIQTNKD